MCNTQPLLNRIHSFKPSSPACKEKAENRAMIPHSYLWIGITAWHHRQQTAKRERESRRQSNDTTQVPVNRDHSLTTLSLDCKEREQKTAMIPHSYLWTGITAWHHYQRTAKRERAEDRAMIPHRYLWTGTTAKNHHHLPAKGEQKTELWYHTATSEQGSQLDSIMITGLQRQRESRRQSFDTTLLPLNRDHNLTASWSLDCKERESRRQSNDTTDTPEQGPQLRTIITCLQREREDKAMISHCYLWTGITTWQHHDHWIAERERESRRQSYDTTLLPLNRDDNLTASWSLDCKERERAEDRAMIPHCYLWTGITTWQHHNHWTAKTMQSHSIYTATSDTES